MAASPSGPKAFETRSNSASLTGPTVTRKDGEMRHGKASCLSRCTNVDPDLLRKHAHIARPWLGEPLEASSLFSDPADFLLVAFDRLRLGDLDAPAAIFLLP